MAYSDLFHEIFAVYRCVFINVVHRNAVPPGVLIHNSLFERVCVCVCGSEIIDLYYSQLCLFLQQICQKARVTNPSSLALLFCSTLLLAHNLFTLV